MKRKLAVDFYPIFIKNACKIRPYEKAIFKDCVYNTLIAVVFYVVFCYCCCCQYYYYMLLWLDIYIFSARLYVFYVFTTHCCLIVFTTCVFSFLLPSPLSEQFQWKFE